MLPVLILFFLASWQGPTASALLLVATLLISVFLHELGHGLMAQRHGIKVVDITFWPLGGLARMSEIPQDSLVESQIAFAGPAANLLLAALAAPFAILLGAGSGVGELAYLFMGINLLLGVFNLIPAFPMDGARVMRALLARKLTWLEATQRTASVGRGLASFLGIAGMFVVLPFGGISPCFMSVFFAGWVWWACTQEVLTVQFRNRFSAFQGTESPFGPFGPIDGDPIDTRGSVKRDTSPPAGGFSSSDIEDLENFRGSLKNRKPE